MNPLKLLPPETAHNIGVWAMQRRWFAPGPIATGTKTLFGHPLLNLLGIAAGFDKNGVLVDVIKDYGFGFIEVGSVTYRGGPGNPKPRMFRVDGGLVNKMGLNGEPAELVARRLACCVSKDYGVNIAKTHDPMIMGDEAIQDIQSCFNKMRGLGFYTVLNISCPNTREGRTFEDPAALRELLSALDFKDQVILIKLSPEFKDETIDVCEDFNINGYVCCNTLPGPVGGISGITLQPHVVGGLKRLTDKVVIACGGLNSKQRYNTYMGNGAAACQVYSGFVNYGPNFASKILG